MRICAAIVLFLIVTSASAASTSKYDLGPRISDQEIAANEAKQKIVDDERNLMKAACINYVKLRLNDPSSAQLPQTTDDRKNQSIAVKQKNGSYKVTFTGRAKNQFNALILVKFQCSVKPIKLDGDNAALVLSSKQIFPE